MNLERQELHCHVCDSYVRFSVDLELEGNHVLNCPKCNHSHYRVVKGGKITGERWMRVASVVWDVHSITFSDTSAYTTKTSSASTDIFLQSAWLNTTTY